MRVSVSIKRTGATPASQSRALRRAVWAALVDLGHATEREWKQIARRKLKTSMEDYIASLEVYPRKSILTYDFLIPPKAFVPWAVEFGWPKYDMKPTYLNSAKAKTGKKGQKYLRVAFYYYARKPRGRPARRKIYHPEAVKGASILKSIRQARTPQALASATQRYKKWSASPKVRRREISREGYVHKAGKVERLTHKQGHKLSTIRTVSENSARNSWIHPGIRARLLHRQVMRKIPRLVRNKFDVIFMSSMGGAV